jgi:hypothetical protein
MLLMLLLWGGIARGVQSTATICDILCYPHLRSEIIPDSSTRADINQQTHLIAKQDKLEQKLT